MSEISVAIADDNERILDLLGEIVENDRELHLVGKANNGEDAYRIIREKQPDVVLLDLIMPKMDGLSVMETVNRDKDLKKQPGFIVITAVGQERITEDAFKNGASYYIMKPFQNDMIVSRIKMAGKPAHTGSADSGASFAAQAAALQADVEQPRAKARPQRRDKVVKVSGKVKHRLLLSRVRRGSTPRAWARSQRPLARDGQSTPAAPL